MSFKEIRVGKELALRFYPSDNGWMCGITPEMMEALEQAEKQEPVAWAPITEPYPPGDELDILMGDGSVLCGVLPQADGDLWWDGSGTGEKFIDPKYANVTHWRVHSDAAPPQRQPLTDEQIMQALGLDAYDSLAIYHARAIEAAHGI